MSPQNSAGRLAQMIFLIRGQKVMLDRHLAQLYHVPTGALNRAIKRNRDRFPPDFIFQLTTSEWLNLKCQFGIPSWGGDRALPYAFTEQGVAMLSSVLKSRRAIRVNIAIMRAFVKIRETLALHKDLAVKLQELETRIAGHDAQIQNVFDAIGKLTEAPEQPHRRIGFLPEDKRRS